MSFQEILPYVIAGAVLLFIGWNIIRFRLKRPDVAKLVQEGAVVLDVRTPEEFSGGARQGSINIPLDQLEARFRSLNPDRPLVVCCASGARSAVAETFLKKQGFKCVVNAGPWTNTL